MILEFSCNDNRYYEDDEALLSEFYAGRASGHSAFWSVSEEDIDNDYEDTFYTFKD